MSYVTHKGYTIYPSTDLDCWDIRIGEQFINSQPTLADAITWCDAALGILHIDTAPDYSHWRTQMTLVTQTTPKQITVIPAEDALLPMVFQLKDDIETLRGLVGGFITPIPSLNSFEGRHCVAYCDEDGERLGLPLNRRATKLWYSHFGHRELRGQPLLRGTVVIVQHIDRAQQQLVTHTEVRKNARLDNSRGKTAARKVARVARP